MMHRHSFKPVLFLCAWSSFLLFVLAAARQPAIPWQGSTLSDQPAPERLVPAESPAAWRNVCVNERIEIDGVGLGDRNRTINPQTISLGNPAQVRWLRAQVAGRITSTSQPLPDVVTLTTGAPQTVSLDQPSSSSSSGYTFETTLQPTGHLTVSITGAGESYKTPRGFILYASRATGDAWTSVGKTTNGYVWAGSDQNSYSEPISLPPLRQPTDIFVTAVVIDNDDDLRPIKVQAEAGAAISSTTELGPSHGPGLNIVYLALPQVETADRVTVTLESPADKGDSAVLVGVNVSYRCPPPEADLAVSKSVAHPTARVGEVVTYTVTVTNHGPDDATGVEISDRLSDKVTFLPPPYPSQGSYNNTTAVWEVGSLARDASASLILAARVKKCTGGRIIPNEASVLAVDQDDSETANDEASASFVSRAYCFYFPVISHDPCFPIDTFTSRESSYNEWPEETGPYIMDYDGQGEYRIRTGDSSLFYIAPLLNRTFDVTDYTIQVDGRWLGESWPKAKYGLIFGLVLEDKNSWKQAYRFLIDTHSKSYYLDRSPNLEDPSKEWYNLVSGDATKALNPDQLPNTLKVTLSAKDIFLYINDRHIMTTTDPVYSLFPGRVMVGFGVYPPDNIKVEGHFDNFVYCTDAVFETLSSASTQENIPLTMSKN